MKTLVLTADGCLAREISAEEAVVKILLGKALLLESYVDRLFRSARQSLPVPRVIMSARYVRRPGRQYGVPRVSNLLLFRRDGHVCQY